MNIANMKPGDIALGFVGQEVLMPPGNRKLTEIRNEIVRNKRAADGTYQEDIIRTYTDYQLDWDILRGTDYDIVTSQIDFNQPQNLIIVNRNGSITQQMVKVHKTTGTRESIAGKWLWSGVSLLLECI